MGSDDLDRIFRNADDDVDYSGHLSNFGHPSWGFACQLKRSGTSSEQVALYGRQLVGEYFPFVAFHYPAVLILPLTKIIAGTTIGIRGVILPLVFYCVPYLARLVESSILEVDSGIIEAYQSMGISNGKIIVNVVLREARSGLVRGLTITTIGLVGATAMAGLVGAGGLGDIAYQYGFQRYQPSVMYATIVVLIVLVQIVQTVGDICAKNCSVTNFTLFERRIIKWNFQNQI